MPSSTTPIPISIPISPAPQPQTPGATHHNNPLSHISFGVRSYSASKTFYTAVLAPLGLNLVFDSEASSVSGTFKKNHIRTLGYGPDKDNEIINIFELGPDTVTAPPGPGFHVALNAPTRLAVVEFHAAAVQNGGADNGLPGVREEYEGDYFAAFVVDPDGHRLEVVCKRRIGVDEGSDGVGEEREGVAGSKDALERENVTVVERR